MRLFRFSSVLSFEIEEKTLAAALLKAPLLKQVSAERINAELTKLLCGEKPEIITALIEKGGLSHFGIAKTKGLERLKNLPPKIGIRLFAFLKYSDGNLPDFLTKFKASNQLKNEVLLFEKFTGMPLASKADIKDLLNMAEAHLVEDYLNYLNAFCDMDTSLQKAMLRQIISNNEPFKISHLAVGGKDLQSLGITGEEIGITLENLRKFVLNSPECNIKEKLLENLNINRN